MKLSPTVPLALVLGACMAAAAVAQTTPGTASEPKSSISKPLAGASTQEMQTTQPKAKSAEMKATQPRVKRTAQVKAAHPRRMTQMTAARTAHLRRPITQAENLPAENLTPDQIKAAQQQLHTAGLYNGPTDGMMDPDTRAALARFQQQNGLRRTETLDPQTLARLNGNGTTGFGSSTAPGGNQTSAPVSAVPGGNQTSAPPSAGGNTATGQPPINR